MKIDEILNEELLLEFIKKIGNRYYVYSHRDPNKRLGRKEGYATRGEAAGAILGMKSKGGFYNLSSQEKRKRIRNYLGDH